jgi:hypothetical protein
MGPRKISNNEMQVLRLRGAGCLQDEPLFLILQIASKLQDILSNLQLLQEILSSLHSIITG